MSDVDHTIFHVLAICMSSLEKNIKEINIEYVWQEKTRRKWKFSL